MMSLLADRWSQMKSCVKRVCVKPSIGDTIFNLHARFTRNILALFGIAVFMYQLFGNPINCAMENNMTTPETINSFCWASETFRLPKEYKNIATDTVYKSYYHWTPLILFGQAVSFFAPFWLLSRKQERSRVVVTLNDRNSNDKSGYRRGRCFINKKVSFISFNILVLCQVLNIVNVVLNLYMMKEFFGDAFTVYGLTILSLPTTSPANRNDTIFTVLPRKIVCNTTDFDMKVDAICTLAINVFSEKIYILLWLWFVFLALISVAEVLYNMFFIQCSFKRPSAKPSQSPDHLFRIPGVIHSGVSDQFEPHTQDFGTASNHDFDHPEWFVPRYYITTAKEAVSTNPEAVFNLPGTFQLNDMYLPLALGPKRRKDGEKTPQVQRDDALLGSDTGNDGNENDQHHQQCSCTYMDLPQITIRPKRKDGEKAQAQRDDGLVGSDIGNDGNENRQHYQPSRFIVRDLPQITIRPKRKDGEKIQVQRDDVQFVSDIGKD